jgi:hypothetical protein
MSFTLNPNHFVGNEHCDWCDTDVGVRGDVETGCAFGGVGSEKVINTR